MRQSMAPGGAGGQGGSGATDWLRMQARPLSKPLARLPSLPAALRRMEAACAQLPQLGKLLACQGIISADMSGSQMRPQSPWTSGRQQQDGGQSGRADTPASSQDDASIGLEQLWEWSCPEAAGLNVACMAWNQVILHQSIVEARLPHFNACMQSAWQQKLAWLTWVLHGMISACAGKMRSVHMPMQLDRAWGQGVNRLP